MRKLLTAVLLVAAFFTVGTGVAQAGTHVEPRVCVDGEIVVVDGDACVDADLAVDDLLGGLALGDTVDDLLDTVGDLVDGLL